MTEPLARVTSLKVSDEGGRSQSRIVPEETAVALVYDGATHGVMMATPADLEDFAVGFSLTEGKIAHADEIAELSVVEQANGVELRMWLKADASARTAQRRRAMLGPTGCGLCGVDSLDAALPELKPVTSATAFSSGQVFEAVAAMRPAQQLNRQAHAVHAAGFWQPGTGLAALREDVGRHNALDKCAGAMAKAGLDAARGIIVLTSRVSIEMVQKAAAIGAPVIAAVSAPTALAVRMADGAGITLVAIARDDSFEVFTHPERLTIDAGAEGRIRRERIIHAAV